MSEDKVIIELSKSEALVLFELVSRFSNDEKFKIENQAEQQVLWNICCFLERKLAEPFDENYNVLLANARKELSGEEA